MFLLVVSSRGGLGDTSHLILDCFHFLHAWLLLFLNLTSGPHAIKLDFEVGKFLFWVFIEDFVYEMLVILLLVFHFLLQREYGHFVFIRKGGLEREACVSEYFVA